MNSQLKCELSLSLLFWPWSRYSILGTHPPPPQPPQPPYRNCSLTLSTREHKFTTNYLLTSSKLMPCYSQQRLMVNMCKVLPWQHQPAVMAAVPSVRQVMAAWRPSRQVELAMDLNGEMTEQQNQQQRSSFLLVCFALLSMSSLRPSAEISTFKILIFLWLQSSAQIEEDIFVRTFKQFMLVVMLLFTFFEHWLQYV